MGGGGGALLETSLVDLGLEQVWGCNCHLGHDGLLEDLGNMEPNNDGPDIL